MKHSYINRFKKPLKAYWWRLDYPERLNFGDEITPLLIQNIFGRRCEWSEPDQCDIAGAGSIIEVLQSLSNGHHVHVWGSGLIKPGEPNTMDNLHFAAVRGKLTQERVSDTSLALGDPGLLLPLALKPYTAGKKYKIGIIPHYVDADLPIVQKYRATPDYLIIDVLQSVQSVADQIQSCEVIFSSSLHGLIVSDAFGIPNYWLPFSDQLTGGDYKFRDYYSVLDQVPRPVKPAMLADKHADKLIAEYSTPRIDHIQQQLIKAFPF